MYLFFLFLTLASLSNAQNVPPFCKICTCENDDNNNFEITCTRNVNMYINDNSYWMDQNNNRSYSYKSLTIHNNPILTLKKQFPPSNIVLLNLANNSIVNISDSIFSNLQNMETLILSYNNIELLHPDAFDGQYAEGDFRPLKSLKKLHLDHNRLHSLDGDIFEHTSRVEVLTLSHNPFKILDQQTIVAITSLVFLKELDLSYTELANLPDYFLHTPKYLNLLDLSGNAFEEIPKTLANSHNLTTLYMNNNPIVNLTSENGFPNISTLKSLHLNFMPELLNISKGALSKLANLEELYIFDNIKLCHIDKAALSARRDGAEYATWPPIKKLYLQDNKLTSIDMQLILNWKSLNALDLTNNPWTCECENQWMVDELMPTYLAIDANKAKSLRCAAPIEMAELTFYDIYQKQSSMRCLDLYGHRPERDGALLVGILAGVLITIPLILFIIYSYQRHWFGIFDDSPASYTRQFYKRTMSNDEYL
ncbi:leucine-rich repeat neuronal protein 1, partial [Asbolus verrucosus]